MGIHVECEMSKCWEHSKENEMTTERHNTHHFYPSLDRNVAYCTLTER